MTQTTKFDIWLDGRSVSVRLPVHIKTAFDAKRASLNLTVNEAARDARRDCNGTLAEAIIKWVGNVPLHATRELWTAALVEAARPVFEKRGYPLPANIRATIAFTSTGWRGKRRGECWFPESSSDGFVEIMVHLCETDPARIFNILVHELCHAAQGRLAKERGKLNLAGGHGRIWKEVAAALDLEPTLKTDAKTGKTKEQWQYALGDQKGAWGEWAVPLLEAAGTMPHAALAEYVKKETTEAKQTTRMLKFTHEGCPAAEDAEYIWRASGKATADKAQVHCPCCGQKVTNPHFTSLLDEVVYVVADEMDRRTVRKVGKAVRKGVQKRAVARQGRKSVVQEMLDDAAASAAREVDERRTEGNRILRNFVDREEGRQSRRKPNRNY